MVLEHISEIGLDGDALNQIVDALDYNQKTRPVKSIVNAAEGEVCKIEATLVDFVEKSPPGSVSQQLQFAIARLDFLGPAISVESNLTIQQKLIDIGCRTMAVYDQFCINLQKYADGQKSSLPGFDSLFRETSSNKAVHTKEGRENIEVNCKYFRYLVGKNKNSAPLISLCVSEPICHVNIDGIDFAKDRQSKKDYLFEARSLNIITDEELGNLQKIFQF